MQNDRKRCKKLTLSTVDLFQMVKITLKTKMDIHIKNVIAYKIQILSPHYMVTFMRPALWSNTVGSRPPSCLLMVFIFLLVTRELNISGNEHGIIFPSFGKMEKSNPTATRIICYFKQGAIFNSKQRFRRCRHTRAKCCHDFCH